MVLVTTVGGEERLKNFSTAFLFLVLRAIEQNLTVNILFMNTHFTHSVFLIMNANITTYFKLSKYSLFLLTK